MEKDNKTHNTIESTSNNNNNEETVEIDNEQVIENGLDSIFSNLSQALREYIWYEADVKDFSFKLLKMMVDYKANYDIIFNDKWSDTICYHNYDLNYFFQLQDDEEELDEICNDKLLKLLNCMKAFKKDYTNFMSDNNKNVSYIEIQDDRYHVWEFKLASNHKSFTNGFIGLNDLYEEFSIPKQYIKPCYNIDQEDESFDVYKNKMNSDDYNIGDTETTYEYKLAISYMYLKHCMKDQTINHNMYYLLNYMAKKVLRYLSNCKDQYKDNCITIDMEDKYTRRGFIIGCIGIVMESVYPSAVRFYKVRDDLILGIFMTDIIKYLITDNFILDDNSNYDGRSTLICNKDKYINDMKVRLTIKLKRAVTSITKT
jgi:hypothetical protein